jgi:KDO2-lipid IV(A) lauroyltransferase
MSDDAPVTRRDEFAYRAYATVAWLGRVLPTHTGRMLFRWVGTAAFHLLPGVRATVADNLAAALGREPDDPLVLATTREAFQSYARYWFDSFDVVGWSDERIQGSFVLEGEEHLRRAVDTRTGAITVSPHMGNWDATGRMMKARGIPVASVAERLRPEALFRLFRDHRAALGMRIVGLGESGTGRRLAEALREGTIVALLADRDITGRGIEVEMFGRSRRLPVGPALLSLTTGAPLLPVAQFETPEGWHVIVHPPIAFEPTGDRRADAEALTRIVAGWFERTISAAPSQWHAFQPWGT